MDTKKKSSAVGGGPALGERRRLTVCSADPTAPARVPIDRASRRPLSRSLVLSPMPWHLSPSIARTVLLLLSAQGQCSYMYATAVKSTAPSLGALAIAPFGQGPSTAEATATANRVAPPLPPPLKPPLQAIIKVNWELMPPLPVGVEDNDGGWVDDSTIVTGFGLSQASYPGCVSTAYSLNTSDPRATWQALPVPPVSPRQEEAATIVEGLHGNEVWFSGGFNNNWQKQGNKQRTMDDMLRLYRDSSGSWAWEVLDLKLPYPVDGHAMAAIKHQLYLFGGDFNEGSNIPAGVGAMLHVLDTRNFSHGWKQLRDCPGRGRSGLVLAPVGGDLFVLGGSADSWRYSPSSVLPA